jgi:DNA-binding transcriptional regulator YiaG
MAMGYDVDVIHKATIIHMASDRKNLSQEITRRVLRPADMDTDAIIQRMRQVYGVRYDTDLATELGLSKAAPSNWRQRNSPPHEICAEVARKNGVSLDWLIFGIGDMRLGARGEAPLCAEGDTLPLTSIPAADRLSQFVYWWCINGTQDEVTWLEQQFKRAVPEYGEWLVNTANAGNG